MFFDEIQTPLKVAKAINNILNSHLNKLVKEIETKHKDKTFIILDD